MSDANPQQQTEIEAAVYRKMIAHFRKYPEVQNIDLMNLAYFCRNCLSKWYRSEAAARGVELTDEQAREIVYGMPYAQYKTDHAREASAEQLE
ncbi:MAG: DUF1244 domain-containing protein, partial [Gammaproteobacteria bacterium]|nr:DUF1244 domain-containing protein [Gammaproteobacteria bacterium]MDA8022843.1 DUF1244 domain-containing protein [Gammaproteobacteria bacterium]